MRSVFLDSNNDDPLLSYARTRMREEEFISSVRAFLSLLAVAEPEYLDYVQSKLLPHRLSFDRGPPAWETFQATQEAPYHPHIAENVQLSDTFLDMNQSSRPISLAPRSTTAETLNSRDLFAKYTTLEDHSPSHDTQASVDTEMLDRHDKMQGNAEARSFSTPHSPTFPRTPNDIMSDVAETSSLSSQVEHHTESTSMSPSSNWSLSPVLDSMYTWSASSPPLTHYLRSLKQLDSLYGGRSEHALKNIPEIIKLGDSFLREDVASFIKSLYSECSGRDLWYRPALSNPAGNDTIMKKLLTGFYCAEVLEHIAPMDPVRLRVSRVLLYHYFESLCIELQANPGTSGQHPRGKTTASVATDKVLDELYSAHDAQFRPRTRKQQRHSLRRHKKIGKRWSIVAKYLGLGILFTCSPSLEAQINDPKFTERMILALLTYTLNAYPQGSQISQKLDPFVKSIIEGASLSSGPSADTLSDIDGYRQEKERECYEFGDDWQPLKLTNGFFRVV